MQLEVSSMYVRTMVQPNKKSLFFKHFFIARRDMFLYALHNVQFVGCLEDTLLILQFINVDGTV